MSTVQPRPSFGRCPSLYQNIPIDEAQALESLARDARCGHFDRTEISLQDPAFARRGDFLSTITKLDCVARQSRYKDIADIVREALIRQSQKTRADFGYQQEKILLLYQAYANIFTKGALRYAITQAKKVGAWISLGGNEGGEMERLVVELWLHVMKHAKSNSTYVDSISLSYPPGNEDDEGNWQGFDKYCSILEKQGLLWDSLTVLKILAPVQPIEWGVDNYTRLANRVAVSVQSDYNDLCRIAVDLAFGRFLISRRMVDEGIQRLNAARIVLDKDTPVAGPRQRLELQLGDVEAIGNGVDYASLLLRWRAVATTAHETTELAIESMCLSQCMQLATRQGDLNAFSNCAARLEKVDRHLAGNAQTALGNKLQEWQQFNRHQFGDILAWFDAFDIEHPLSPFLLGSSAHEVQAEEWDIPTERYREETFKYHYFTRLGHLALASDSLAKASSICKFVPLVFAQEIGLGATWLFEWQNISSGESLAAETVLFNRIHSHCSTSTDIVSLHFARDFFEIPNLAAKDLPHFSKTLQPPEVTSRLFTNPLQLSSFTERLSLVQAWFEAVTSFNASASSLIIAQLKLTFLMRNAPSAKPEAVAELSWKFVDHVAKIPDPEVKAFLEHSSLLQRQRASDAFLFMYWPNLSRARLFQLKEEYLETLATYRASRYANEFADVARIYARLGEVELFLQDDDDYLARFKARLDETEKLFNRLRQYLSSLEPSRTLQLRSSLQGSLGGHQVVLRRTISNLVVLYNSFASSKMQQDAIASMLWTFIQRMKSRALLDKLGAEAELPPISPAMQVDNITPKVDVDTREISSRLQARTVEPLELADACSSDTPLVFVDWFIADIPGVLRALHMMVLRLSSVPGTPEIFRLTPGIEPRTIAWPNRYLAVRIEDIDQEQAFDDLQTLHSLVKPLETVTTPGETLVFCPTSEWSVNRIPLHAIEIAFPEAISKNINDEMQGATTKKGTSGCPKDILLRRNRIVYTHSHSLMHANIRARREKVAAGAKDRRARVLSPLTQLPPLPHVSPLIQAFTTTLTRRIEGTLNGLADFFQAPIIPANTITERVLLADIQGADIFFFLGHVHGLTGTSTNALQQHMMLYHPQVNPFCAEGEHPHEAQTSASAETILRNGRMAHGAHVAMLACGSSISTYTSADEALGLVTAFLHSGASSVLSTSWDVSADDVCRWIIAYREAWQRQEQDLASDGQPGSVNLLKCSQDAALDLVEREGKTALFSWAAFVHYGYWMFPAKRH